jgi:hypothetical protein
VREIAPSAVAGAENTFDPDLNLQLVELFAKPITFANRNWLHAGCGLPRAQRVCAQKLIS